MKISTTGLVLLEQNVGENDRLITILTEKEGIIRAFAKSAKNFKTKNSSATQLLSYSKFIIYKSKDKYIINDSDLIELFFDLRGDIIKFSLAQYFCELTLVFAPRGENSGDFLRLILNSFYYLAHEKISQYLLKSIFELRIISMAGFMPNLVCCKICNEYDANKMYLFFEGGEIVCDKCVNINDKRYTEIPKSIIFAMRYIIYSELKKIFSFKLSNDNQKILNNICERYLLTHVDRDFKTLKFYKEILL